MIPLSLQDLVDEYAKLAHADRMRFGYYDPPTDTDKAGFIRDLGRNGLLDGIEQFRKALKNARFCPEHKISYVAACGLCEQDHAPAYLAAARNGMTGAQEILNAKVAELTHDMAVFKMPLAVEQDVSQLRFMGLPSIENNKSGLCESIPQWKAVGYGETVELCVDDFAFSFADTLARHTIDNKLTWRIPPEIEVQIELTGIKVWKAYARFWLAMMPDAVPDNARGLVALVDVDNRSRADWIETYREGMRLIGGREPSEIKWACPECACVFDTINALDQHRVAAMDAGHEHLPGIMGTVFQALKDASLLSSYPGLTYKKAELPDRHLVQEPTTKWHFDFADAKKAKPDIMAITRTIARGS